MAINNNNDAPCLINCRQGVSVLYKEHYLYSKYEPSKSILNIISNLILSDNTLILIFSPVLWLGLNELFLKLKSNCKIVAFEFDNNLYNFSVEHLDTEFTNKINFYNSENLSNFFNKSDFNNFTKVTKIDFSAGTSFFKDKYQNVFSLTQTIINQQLKNRLTLIKFGRLYSKNIFKNLSAFCNSIPFESFYKKIAKPILILGAGQSLDYTITELKKIFLQNKRDIFFIISVDASLNTLLQNKIIPDAVIAVESQFAIQKAFIGLPKNSKILFFCDAVSRRSLKEIINGNFSFFISNYSNLHFFEKLQSFNILPPLIKPMGSVGLVAMQIALMIRKNEKTPILFSGLDFSYSNGITHAKETVAHKNQLMLTNKLKSIFNFDSAFLQGTQKIISKDSKTMTTSVALKNYALLFEDLFESEKNIFDVSKTGIKLNFLQKELSFFIDYNAKNAENESTIDLSNLNLQNNKIQKDCVLNFISQERDQLNKLKNLFIDGDKSCYRDTNISLQEQIENLIFDKEYLFIHFADAYKMPRTQSFYNRVRIELEFFLKELNQAEKLSGKL